MNTMTQILAVTGMNLQTLPQRRGTSSVIVVGIAGVVAVFVSVLAMSTGLIKTLGSSGKADRAIVVRVGASSELVSSLPYEATLTIADSAGVRRDADGKGIASPEGLRIANVMRKDGVEANVPIRGVTPQMFAVRPEIKLIEGRMFRDGINELIIGKAARNLYKDANIGDQFHFRDADWTVVGVYASNGDSRESEILADLQTLNSAFRRGNSVQSVTVQLESAASFDTFRDAITTNPALQVETKRESEYFKQQSASISRILEGVAYVVGGIMAVGALFGALNALYSAVSSRAKEIATLRAIGFGATPVVVSVFVEALLLSLLGGIIGAALAWLLFNGHSVSTSASGGNNAIGGQLIFDLAVTPTLVAIGIGGAGLIGFIGGLLPAIRAARLPVATALRAL
jgi:putative ABC transport system permease protein